MKREAICQDVALVLDGSAAVASTIVYGAQPSWFMWFYTAEHYTHCDLRFMVEGF